MGAWSEVKEQRARQLGRWVCECCGCKLTQRTAIGHHVRHKSSGGKSVISNIMLRCRDCETADPHCYQGKKDSRSKGHKTRDYIDEMKVWKRYCRTGRL